MRNRSLYDMELKVFTLNCWGIPIISKHRKQRIGAIADSLANSDYDVVCLQEVWADKDYKLIKETASRSLPFSHYFYSGVIGSGICILSKYPINRVFFHQWPVNGYVHKIQHGDWFGGKGIGLCCLKINGFNINIYSAHLHAEYNRICDQYKAHRMLQAYDTAQFIKLTSGDSDLVILAGDLNTEPGDLAYRMILHEVGFKDSYVLQEMSPSQFGTNECWENSYTPTSLTKKKDIGKRIDYVMFKTNSHTKAEVKRYDLPLPRQVPGFSFSFSDHEAILVTLNIKAESHETETDDDESRHSILNTGIETCERALKNLRTHKIFYWVVTSLMFILVVGSIPFDAPYAYKYLIHVLRVLVTCLICYTLVMGSLWNNIESHGILAGKLAMEVSLKQVSEKKY